MTQVSQASDVLKENEDLKKRLFLPREATDATAERGKAAISRRLGLARSTLPACVAANGYAWRATAFFCKPPSGDRQAAELERQTTASAVPRCWSNDAAQTQLRISKHNEHGLRGASWIMVAVNCEM